MAKEKYYKELKDLTIQELYCYGIKLGLTRPSPIIKKAEIVKNIVQKKSDFLENTDTKYYFTTDGNTLEYIESPTNFTDYKQKKLQSNCQIPVAQLKEEIQKEKDLPEHDMTSPTISLKDFKVENDEIVNTKYVRPQYQLTNVDNQTVTTDQLSKILENLTTRNMTTRNESTHNDRTVPFRQKIQYQPSHGIEAFIRSVESYAAANDITDKLKWIAIAKSALNSSEDGLLLQDALLPAEDSDWVLFKNRLLSILGNPPDYYRDFYRSFRRGSQKLGLSMSRLTQAYKRGFLAGSNNLSESDKQHIIHQFIACLDNPLRGLLKAEEKTLTFSKIADRAAELERCFGTGFMPDSAATLMFPEARVQMVETANNAKMQDTINLKMVEMINQIMTQSNENHKEMMREMKGTRNDHKNNSSNETRNERPRNYGERRKNWFSEIIPKLDGHCAYWVKNGKCRLENKCLFKHESNVPIHIKNLFKD